MIGIVDVDPLIFRAGFAGTERWYEVTFEDGHVEEIQYKKDIPDEGVASVEQKQKSAPIEHVLYNLKTLYKRVIPSLLPSCNRFKGYITGDHNFRYTVASDYKANRVGILRPEHLQEMRDYCIKYLGVSVIHSIEADDACAIMCSKHYKKSVLVAVDKDLLQVPGYHLNPVKEQKKVVTPLEGIRFFFKQLIMGDPSDNIAGLRGYGPRKADKLLEGITSPKEMYETVLAEWCNNGHTEDDMYRSGILLYMLRRSDDSFDRFVDSILNNDSLEDINLVKEPE